MDFKELSDSFSQLGKIDLGKIYDSLNEPIKINMPKYEFPNYEIPEIIPIDPEDTIIGEIKRKIEEQNELSSKQISILMEQNHLLADNYNKLKNMYDEQVRINIQSNKDLEQSRRYNRWMMGIAFIAMLAAIAGPIVTLIVSK